jgi:hypothetical protein
MRWPLTDDVHFAHENLPLRLQFSLFPFACRTGTPLASAAFMIDSKEE